MKQAVAQLKAAASALARDKVQLQNEVKQRQQPSGGEKKMNMWSTMAAFFFLVISA